MAFCWSFTAELDEVESEFSRLTEALTLFISLFKLALSVPEDKAAEGVEAEPVVEVCKVVEAVVAAVFFWWSWIRQATKAATAITTTPTIRITWALPAWLIFRLFIDLKALL